MKTSSAAGSPAAKQQALFHAETPASAAGPRGLVLVQRKGKRPRKSPSGVATNTLVFSAGIGRNSEMFPNVLSLYVKPGSLVADVTFGKGAFWKTVPAEAYRLLKSDLSPKRKCGAVSADSRCLPYASESLDCVVFDPPYMHTPGGTAHDGHQNFEEYYQNNGDNTTEKNIMRPFWICTSNLRTKPSACCEETASTS